MMADSIATLFVVYTYDDKEIQYKRKRGGEWNRTTYDYDSNLIEPETPVDGSVIREMSNLV
jgi:hypothetical protein